MRYIRARAKTLSGEAMVSNVRSLLRTLKGHISSEKEEKVREVLPWLRREGNKRQPPGQQAAEAIRLEDLKELLGRARKERVSEKERRALDIFQVAFVTMSRVGEVAALRIEDVTREGSMIALRPKTSAKTWKKLTKRVSDKGGFRAAEVLREYREEAVAQGRATLFGGRKDKPPETAEITRTLRGLGERLGEGMRLTSHSARKGAAVEAVLAGVPLPVVQALGGWKDLNTLQAYIGEAIRRTSPLMEILNKDKKGTREERTTESWIKGVEERQESKFREDGGDSRWPRKERARTRRTQKSKERAEELKATRRKAKQRKGKAKGREREEGTRPMQGKRRKQRKDKEP